MFGHAKTCPGPKTHFLGLAYEKYGNQVPNFENVENTKHMLTEILCIMDRRFSKRAHEVPI